jgi:hypothetical protein
MSQTRNLFSVFRFLFFDVSIFPIGSSHWRSPEIRWNKLRISDIENLLIQFLSCELELELELIQTHMAQKPLLGVEVGAHAVRKRSKCGWVGCGGQARVSRGAWVCVWRLGVCVVCEAFLAVWRRQLSLCGAPCDPERYQRHASWFSPWYWHVSQVGFEGAILPPVPYRNESFVSGIFVHSINRAL